MFGEENALAGSLQSEEQDSARSFANGIVPWLLRDLFLWTAASGQRGINRAVRMSCFQIYCNQVRSFVGVGYPLLCAFFVAGVASFLVLWAHACMRSRFVRTAMKNMTSQVFAFAFWPAVL